MRTRSLRDGDRYHHGDLSNACVQAALDLLNEGGRGAVTLRAVAHRIGVSRSAPYRHFADKQSLLAACAARGFDRLVAEAEAVVATCERCDVDTLRALLGCYGRFGIAMPHLYRLMFACEFRGGAYPELEAAAGRVCHQLHETVERGQRAGTLRPGGTADSVLLLWSSLHGLVSLCNDLAPSAVFDSSDLACQLDRVFAVVRPAFEPS